MKKTIVALVLVIAAMAIFATGIAFAQGPQPATGFGMGLRGTGEGPLHDYMVGALAKALGITPADFESRRDAGKTAYQIALDLGISADKIPVLLADARAKAFDAAVAAGVLTQQQAMWMKFRGMMAGTGLGTCTGMGQGRGGGMGRGGRWQQTNP